ncbi:MAG: hypothetical protein RIS70_3137, partial [Planctomycetota bacterium]
MRLILAVQSLETSLIAREFVQTLQVEGSPRDPSGVPPVKTQHTNIEKSHEEDR